ncbi:MAG TPA: VWA domain-containing protein [Bryobacteraceae bacterium]|nr:VWA domain-containing protein [Bryobacteraceae bacterium]
MLARNVLLIALMRAIAAPLLFAAALHAQFKSTVPLVVSPVTVTDSRGHAVNGLTAADLTLFDNSVPQKIQLQVVDEPVSLAVLIQVSPNASAVLDKLGRSANLFEDMLAGYQGETALFTFSDHVQLAQDFTDQSSKLTKILKSLRPKYDGAALYDALSEAVHALDQRDSARRRILLVIAQTRDHGSKTKLDTLLRDPALQNTTIYWLTYSTFFTPFTSKTKTKWDRMTDEEKQDPKRGQGAHPFPTREEEEGLPPDIAPGSLINIFTSIANEAKVDAAPLLSRATGGRTWGFLKQSGLEEAIHSVADEAHQQYIVTFSPAHDEPGIFHALRAEVKGRPELKVRTRTGYWSVK